MKKILLIVALTLLMMSFACNQNSDSSRQLKEYRPIGVIQTTDGRTAGYIWDIDGERIVGSMVENVKFIKL